MLTAALEYAAKGWRVFPLRPGKKEPGVKAWQRVATTDPQQIRDWWTDDADGARGIGLACGPGSGVWVLDVDDFDAGRDLAQRLECDLEETYVVLTGKGQHHYYRWSDGLDVRNDQSGKLGAGIDIRGDGGYVVAPPTIHPTTQRPYEHEVSSLPEPADPPEALRAALAALSAPVAVPAGSKRTSTAGDRPGDLWAAATSWADILQPRGWTLHHVDRAGVCHWTRPGKEPRDGASATTGYTDNDHLKVFTTNPPAGLESGGLYSKLGFYAAMEHGNDLAAAATALAEQGYRTERPEAPDLAELIAAPQDVEPEPDIPLQPIVTEAPPLPPWPVDELPAWVRDHVVETAERLSTPVDLVAQFAVGALSAVCMGHVDVQVYGWREPTNLYLWTALHSGGGKSPAERRSSARCANGRPAGRTPLRSPTRRRGPNGRCCKNA